MKLCWTPFVDLLQNATYQSLRQLRRMAERRPEAFTELERVWSWYANGEEISDGQVATMHSIVQGMGWHWQTSVLFMSDCWSFLKAGGVTRSGKDCGLTNGEKRKQTQRHERHRIHGRHRQARHFQSEQRNDLCELLCGCVWTQKRQFDCQRAETPLCPFCGEEPEDEEHILWRCPRWVMLRREKQVPNDLERSAWPPCTSRCGSFLKDPESTAWADMGPSTRAHSGPSTRAHSISCNTLPDSVLSDE